MRLTAFFKMPEAMWKQYTTTREVNELLAYDALYGLDRHEEPHIPQEVPREEVVRTLS